jgi:hypothetical protein
MERLEFFIVTTMKTSNLTWRGLVCRAEWEQGNNNNNNNNKYLTSLFLGSSPYLSISLL